VVKNCARISAQQLFYAVKRCVCTSEFGYHECLSSS
jgi:hypothetical protein